MGEGWQRIGYWFLQFYRGTLIFFAVWWLWPVILGVALLVVCLPFLLWGWFFSGGYQHGGHSYLMAAPLQSENRESATISPTQPAAYDDTPQIVERLNRVDLELHELYLRIDELRDRADARFAESATVVGGKWHKLAALDPDMAFQERFKHLETLTHIPPGRAQDDYTRITIREWADNALLQLAQYSQDLDQIEKVVLDSPANKSTNRLAQ